MQSLQRVVPLVHRSHLLHYYNHSEYSACPFCLAHWLSSQSPGQATFLSFYPTHTVKLGRTENPTPKNVIRSRDTYIPLNNHLRHVTVGFVALVESLPLPSSHTVLSTKGEASPDFCQCWLGLFVLLSKLFPCWPEGLVKAAERQELLMMCHTQSRYLSPKSAKTQIMTHMIITNRPCH